MSDSASEGCGCILLVIFVIAVISAIAEALAEIIADYWILLVAFLTVAALLWAGWFWIKKEEARKEQEEARKKEEEERKEKEEAKRRAIQNMLETPWWSIPVGSTLLIDTCVWMECNMTGIETWFAMLRKQAYQKQWKILVMREVYEEIIHHTKSEDSQKAADARHARKLISQFQDAVGREEWFVLEELGKEAVGERYADPALIEAAVRMPHAILVTFDGDLKIRAIEYAKAQGKHVNVLTQEMYSYCCQVEEGYLLFDNNELEGFRWRHRGGRGVAYDAIKEEEEARKKEEDAKRRAIQKMLETPWWSIPVGSTLLIDTCVWMGCNKTGIETWFAMLRKQAYQKQWKILVMREVYEEIIHHTKSEDSEKAAYARHARKLVSQFQDEAGREEWFVVEGLGKEAVGERYADPALIEAAVRMPHAILVTFDGDLKIRAIEYAKAQGKHVNILTQGVYSYYGCLEGEWRLLDNNQLERNTVRCRGVAYGKIFNDSLTKK